MKTQSTLALLVLLGTYASADTLQYTMQTLGTGPGFYSRSARINNNGQVIGYTYTSQFFSSRGRGFIYSNGEMTDIGVLEGGLFSNSVGLNEKGQVVGDASNPQNLSHAVIYENGLLTDIDPIIGDSFYSYANAINNKGQIVGSTNLGAYLFDSGVKTRLSTMDAAYDINDSGAIAGINRLNHAAIYYNGTVQDLGTLGGNSSMLLDINENGQGVGRYATSSGVPKSFIYKDGQTVDLGILEGGNLCYANALNDQCWAVGMATYNGSSYLDTHGFVYHDGLMYDLNDIVDSSGDGWNIFSATGINNSGWIAASAYNSLTGEGMAVLLKPVPEPVTLSFATLCAAAALNRRRKRK